MLRQLQICLAIPGEAVVGALCSVTDIDQGCLLDVSTQIWLIAVWHFPQAISLGRWSGLSACCCVHNVGLERSYSGYWSGRCCYHHGKSTVKNLACGAFLAHYPGTAFLTAF